jgi:DNA-binding NtrC family response regulator
VHAPGIPPHPRGRRVDAAVCGVHDARVIPKAIGEDPVFTRAIAAIPAIARHDAAVLITGETGTGKELVARAIHDASARAHRPFVCVNCASFPDMLMEDALFGHEAGAFSDARFGRAGLLAEADMGSFFLDEVEALTPRAQAALLRVVQDGTFHPLGSAQQQRTDIRIIAATNAPLEQLVLSGTFRSDLYHRLRVLCIDLPPLRERKGDVLLLARHFLFLYTPAGRPPLELDDAATRVLTSHSWPGNVRELDNAMLRAAMRCRAQVIGPDVLDISSNGGPPGEPDSIVGWKSYRELKQEAIAAFERRYLTELLSRHRGNITHAARAAGKERRELGKLLKKHGVDPGAFRDG